MSKARSQWGRAGGRSVVRATRLSRPRLSAVAVPPPPSGPGPARWWSSLPSACWQVSPARPLPSAPLPTRDQSERHGVGRGRQRRRPGFPQPLVPGPPRRRRGGERGGGREGRPRLPGHGTRPRLARGVERCPGRVWGAVGSAKNARTGSEKEEKNQTQTKKEYFGSSEWWAQRLEKAWREQASQLSPASFVSLALGWCENFMLEIRMILRVW